MTQEEKQLLLQDLCARLPYGVKVLYKNIIMELFVTSTFFYDMCCLKWDSCKGYYNQTNAHIGECKPYLRPMSSMTEEEFEKLKEYSELMYDQLDLASFKNGTYKCLDFYLNEVPSYVVIKVFDWLNRNHFDYRGLIEMDLAITVTKENNPYK